MRWYHGLYVGNTARRKRYEILWKVRHKAGMLNVYLITLASNEKDLLDIFNSSMLLQSYFDNKDMLIVGIACGYDEAVETAVKIVEDVYKATGGFNVREYLSK